MSIENPVILYPDAGPEIRTNAIGTLVSGTTVARTTGISYQYAVVPEGFTGTLVYSSASTVGVSFEIVEEGSVATEIPWSLDTKAIPGFGTGYVLHLKVYAEASASHETSLPTSYVIHGVNVSSVKQQAPTPSGLSVQRSNTFITVDVAELLEGTYSGRFIGFNFYVSLEAGGGASGYVRANKDYVRTSSGTLKTANGTQKSTVVHDGVMVETSVSAVYETPKYSFVLDSKTLQNLVADGTLPNIKYSDATVFYFVATSVLFDSNASVEIESLYSPEVSVRFLSFVPEFKELPARNRDDILLSMSNRLMALNRAANVISGSVYRDLLDPVSEELANGYVIQDFVSRSQSMDGLLQIDDENGDGISDAVSSSVYKKRLQVALGVSNDVVVQSIIDSAFDKKASDFSITRLPPTYSSGKATFYTNTVPTEGLYISNGAVLIARSPTGEAINFVVQGSKNLFYSEKDRYYNATTRRYEVVCDIKAAVTGSGGNLGAGAINTIGNGADSRWKVTNTIPTTGGSYTESNNSLANRTKLALAGVDTGTGGGYMLTAVGVPGVKFALAVQAGDPLMFRDMDPSTGEHLGGKVDVYVQGASTVQWQDIFAFSYGGPVGAGSGDRFFVEDAESFLLRTDSPAVTVATPIFEVLRVTNMTRGADYDIAGAVVGTGDGDSIQLAQNSTNLSIGMATLDVIEVDYRYRGYNRFTMSHQPVESIVSVTGDIDGALPAENFRLVKLEDPMYNGNSTAASDGVEIVPFRGLPSNAVSNITGEAHTMLLDKPAQLVKRGIDTSTIVVSSDVSQLDVFDRDVDYKVVRGGDHAATQLVLTKASRIRNSSVVYVSYTAGQNFTVVYSYNKTLEDVQQRISASRHATADVVAKKSIGNNVSISVRVTRKQGYSESDVANNITNNLAAVIQNLPQGTGYNMDDMVNIVKNTEGVKITHLPPYRMMKENGSFILNDVVGLVDFQVYSQNASMGVTSYISVDPVLSYGTQDGGGPSNLFRALYEDSFSLVMVGTPVEVALAAGRGYIRGDRRIVVSTRDGMPPQTKQYRASYYTYVPASQEFAADILVDAMEYLTIGANSITVDASIEESISRGIGR